MSLAWEILKFVVTVVGGTILVFLAISAVVVPLMFLIDAIRNRGRPHRATGPSAFARIRGRMTRATQPTLLLVPAKHPGFSKLGGDPELPVGTAWPDDGGRPRTFVAQIDLGALRTHGGPAWLPNDGRLYAFVDEERYGFADLVRVLSTTEPPGSAVPPPARTAAFPERRVAFEVYPSAPSLDWLDVDLQEANLSGDELDDLADTPDAAFGDELQHRIGGYPSEIQSGQMAISCELIRRGLPEDGEAEVTPAIARASKQWRLLLQVDSDPALKMNWGDGGRLYVFVRGRDALAGDFSRTVTISQTY